MSAERVQGLAETFALFDAVKYSAQEQLGVELALIGRDVLALERADAPKRTGALEAGLSVRVILDKLLVQIGLIGTKRGRSNLFYGRIIEGGRRAQTVRVQRRRRVNGRLRLSGGRKRVEDLVAQYSMKVKARAPHRFVWNHRDDLDRIAAERLAEFWSNTLKQAGAA